MDPSSPPRSILITGANGGLGLAIAREFLSEPNTFVWLGIRERRLAADDLVAEFPKRSATINLDVINAADWVLAVEEILRASGRIDVLVNNAGRHDDHLLATMPAEAWTDVLDSNLSGVFHGCQAVVKPMMAQRHGRIINISSLSALLAPAGQTNYAAAKAGVVALTQSFAKEVARAGITVNAVCPGFIDTEALASLDESRRREITKGIPMRRFGRPGEVAAAVRFLASAKASYITGSFLKIDGGIY